MIGINRALLLLASISSGVAACGGVSPDPIGPLTPDAANVQVDAGLKRLIFDWAEVPGATHYRLFQDPDGRSGFTQVGADVPAGTLSVSLTLAVHFQDFVNAVYKIEACNGAGCAGSNELSSMNVMLDTIGYFTASNTGPDDGFATGTPGVALSADGTTLAVGAFGEDSNATGIGGDQTDNSAAFSGAVYVFRFDGSDWSQQAYVKASNGEAGDAFGWAVSLSADGNTLVVGAFGEDSNATGIDGDQNDNSALASGAVYVYGFDGTDWSQQAYVKASNTEASDSFGQTVALSADGTTLAIGALGEASVATGVGGDQGRRPRPMGKQRLVC